MTVQIKRPFFAEKILSHLIYVVSLLITVYIINHAVIHENHLSLTELGLIARNPVTRPDIIELDLVKIEQEKLARHQSLL